MKKILACILCVSLLTVPCVAVEPLPENTFSLNCDSALLMETQTGTVLYAKGEHDRRSPASVTKVMTLLLVAEAVASGAVGRQDTVTASSRAASMGGSQIWLEEGERMSVEEMAKCVAVVSANDCAVALAEHLCGSEEAFVARMNQRAAELGMENTHFTNCTGLFEDPEHYTSAYDIALMSRELLRHEFIRTFTGIWMDSIRGGEFGLTNTNKLVYHYDGCTGLKTGFTATAMFCLAASAKREDVEYIAVILHGDTSQDRFDAARTLLDYAFANYALYTPTPGEELPAIPVKLGQQSHVQPVCAEAEVVLMEKAARARISSAMELPEQVNAPVEAGQELGSMVLYDGGQELARIPLVAETAVGRLSYLQVWLHLLRQLLGQRAV